MDRSKILIVGTHEVDREEQTKKEKMILRAPDKFNNVGVPKSGKEKRRERRKKKRLTKYNEKKN